MCPLDRRLDHSIFQPSAGAVVVVGGASWLCGSVVGLGSVGNMCEVRGCSTTLYLMTSKKYTDFFQ